MTNEASDPDALVEIIAPPHSPSYIHRAHSLIETIGTEVSVKFSPYAITVAMIDEETMRQLHGQFLQERKVTNVLSFPQYTEKPSGPVNYWGDVALCLEQLQKEAKAQNKKEADHFCHLFVHGVLHLLGYRHDKSEQAEEMEACEIAILQKAGIENPYKEQPPE